MLVSFFTAIFYVLPFVLLDLAKKTSISDKLANFRYKLFGTVFGLSILLSFVILAATALSPMTSYNSLTTQTAHTEDVPTMKKRRNTSGYFNGYSPLRNA
ncbi:hypothetical protein [Apilactobacillus ozensis]|uniref:hypothetical protein n=1 Tax=Apilactobacillus ozensis TaxID=866801 RepID=UPI002092B0D9|nr:hypothetical protein [Apilactobacillus ozensis]